MFSFAVAGCIYVPRTKVVDDPGCQSVRRSVVLEEQKISNLQQCTNNGCLGQLISVGIISAASVVVSGSIVIVGNVVYWIEREKKCVSDKSLTQ
jgi:hypothetical protein